MRVVAVASFSFHFSPASFVSVYHFDPEKRAWKKLDCEGCLFVVRRSVAPAFQLLVLNKTSPKDHWVGLGEIELNDTYLMMSTPDHGIMGYWFYDGTERELVTLQIQKALLEMSGDGGGTPPIPPVGVLHVEEFAGVARLQDLEDAADEGSGYGEQRERFRRALIRLLQTDDQFVDTIYQEFQNVLDE